ncbi:hypothetical protein EVAR_97180_1 [Eumeta japonica]|uniref:Uncharacterized protein n=1 Tax=Eumeta variegata TaxID=151549 RepID=A0A4C1WH43_EUMVA|nr:hypothetical protein EVAR_97180_1 [Eumeta japonica]
MTVSGMSEMTQRGASVEKARLDRRGGRYRSLFSDRAFCFPPRCRPEQMSHGDGTLYVEDGLFCNPASSVTTAQNQLALDKKREASSLSVSLDHISNPEPLSSDAAVLSTTPGM